MDHIRQDLEKSLIVLFSVVAIFIAIFIGRQAFEMDMKDQLFIHDNSPVINSNK